MPRHRKVAVATAALVGALCMTVVGPKVREVMVWGDLSAYGRSNVRAGRAVADELRRLNPDVSIEDDGWIGAGGIGLATVRYRPGFSIDDDLVVPTWMTRTTDPIRSVEWAGETTIHDRRLRCQVWLRADSPRVQTAAIALPCWAA